MSEPTLELQKAVIAKLLQSGPLMALVQDRVFDDVPPVAGFPRITYGDEDVSADDFDCVVSHVVFLPIHIWSTKIGKPECKEIAGMVRNILHEEELSLDGFALLSLHHDTTRYLRDPDGKTNHGIVTFRAMIDELPLVTEGVAEEVIPDWVPDGAYFFADPENSRYWLDGAEVTRDDLFESFDGGDPYFIDGAGGWSFLSVHVKAAVSAPMLAGCTIMFESTPGGTGGSTFVQARLHDEPAELSRLETLIRAGTGFVTWRGYTGGDQFYSNAGRAMVVSQRNKAASVLVPGTRVAFAINGVVEESDAQGAAPDAPNTLELASGSVATITHNITAYLGNKTDPELVALTTL